MIFQSPVQPIHAEDLPAEEYRFIKAQQAIYNFCKAIDRDQQFKSRLEKVENQASFIRVAAENGYEFTLSDLQFALQGLSENADIESDEFEDYELSEEELEMVAGGTASRRGATINSYWHNSGIRVDGQCFYLLTQSPEQRQVVIQALTHCEEWEWKGNNTVQVTDTNGSWGTKMLSNITLDTPITGDMDNGFETITLS